jgi:methanethiol S-methyltransferase
MVKRIGFFAYGVISYAIFFATFLYAIAFVGDFAVPRTLDGAAKGPLAAAIAIDAALLGVFAVQHSVMARRWFKERWTRIVSPAIERSTYVLFASLALILVFWQWRPLGGIVWSVQDPIGRTVLLALFGFGWALVLFATFLINHFDLFGVRQVWLALRGRPYTKLTLGTPGPYRVVRHPLYAGFVLAFWMTPAMTYAHLLFAVATTAYILLAIQFEERDLVHEHGASYEEYRRSVPMLIPFTTRRSSAARQKLERIGTAAFIAFLIKGIVWLAIASAVVRR